MSISGSTLKLIALVTMLIDHIGAAVLYRMCMIWNVTTARTAWIAEIPFERLVEAYNITRDIGRIAFPIYCFLMVEGFQRTHNRRKYALRMLFFALVSEIPFDLAFSSKVLEFEHQNVFFTLFLGLLAMIVTDIIEQKIWDCKNPVWNNMIQSALTLFSVGAFAGAAWLMHTDYNAFGVIAIMLLYCFRRNRVSQMLVGAMAFLWERTAVLAFFPIACYNGERGLKLKYVFYLFYPFHLLILYFICRFMGISWIPAI